jgi:hypothetical protein
MAEAAGKKADRKEGSPKVLIEEKKGFSLFTKKRVDF